MRCALCIVFVLLASSAGMRAAERAASPSIAPPADLVHHLERLAAGQPVPVVAVISDARLARPVSVPERTDGGLQPALQDVGAAFSDPERPGVPTVLREQVENRRTVFIPFEFPDASGIWTIATDRYRDVSIDQGPRDVFALNAVTLFGVFCRSLDERQLTQATYDGLRWNDLSPIQQRLLAAAFHHPYALYRGSRQAGPDSIRYTSSSEAPLPIEKGTLRLYSAYRAIFLPILKEPGETDLYFLQEDGLQLQLAETEAVPFGMPAPMEAKQKPGDLDFDARVLDPPLGLAGIHPLGDVIAEAVRATHLSLKVDARYADRATFIGSAALRTGDVLRVLAFDLQGAWRKVGSTYLLTWDRRGVVPVRIQMEDLRPDDTAIGEALGDLKKTTQRPGWDDLARKVLRPDPSLPLGPTPEQIADIMRPLPDVPSGDPAEIGAVMSGMDARTAFSALRPDQQDAIRTALKGRRTRKSDRSLHPDEPITEAMLQQGYVYDHVVRPVLDIPGTGRLNLYWSTRTTIDTFAAPVIDFFMRRQAAQAKAPAPPPAPATPPSPPVLASGVRAVAPPPLTLGDWARLIAEMRRKGLNTLYVPVLWDGQTLFPSRFFPALPATRGKDMLAQVLAMAKREGFTTVGVIHSLAWRFPGSRVHWLAKHPGWVDVDAAGRTRLEWLKGHPNPELHVELPRETRDQLVSDPLLLSDCVRPAEPAVKARLLGLLGELRRYQALDGVALAHWSRVSGPGYYQFFTRREAAPPLGYSLPDRIAYLDAKGSDPIDLNDNYAGITMPGPDTLAAGFDEDKPVQPWNAFRFAQDAGLAKDLIAEMEKGWPGRVQVFSDLTDLADAKVPQADVTVRTGEAAKGGKTAYRRVPAPFVTVEMQSRSEAEEQPRPVSSSADPEKRLDAFRTSLETAIGAQPKGILLDFTGSPDLLWKGLALLPNTRVATGLRVATD